VPEFLEDRHLLFFLERSASGGLLVLESRAEVVRQLVDDVVLFSPREVVADGAQVRTIRVMSGPLC
jgi:hypothetical protein